MLAKIRKHLIQILALIITLVVAFALMVAVFFLSPETEPPRPERVVLVLDVSAPMDSPAPGGHGLTYWEATQEAIYIMLDRLARTKPTPFVSIITFDDRAHRLVTASQDMWGVKVAVRDTPQSFTSPAADLDVALEQTADQLGNARGATIILVTAGQVGTDLTTWKDWAQDAGHCFYTFGLGDHDFSRLDALATCPDSDYFTALEGQAQTSALYTGFDTAAFHVADLTPTIYSGVLDPGASTSINLDMPGQRRYLFMSMYVSDTGLMLYTNDPRGLWSRWGRQINEGMPGRRFSYPDAGRWELLIENENGQETIHYFLVTATQFTETILALDSVKITFALTFLMVILSIFWLSYGINKLAPRWREPVQKQPAAVGQGVLLNPATGDRFPLQLDHAAVASIGSAPDCTIRLEDAAPHQAEIHYTRGKYFLHTRNGDTPPTFHNGEPTTIARLADGDELVMGETMLRFREQV